MDFGLAGIDNFLCSNSATAAHTNNGGISPSETDSNVIKHRLYGSGQGSAVDEDDLRAFKLAKTKIHLQGCNNNSEHYQQMLSFSSPNTQMLSFSSHNPQSVAFPFYPHSWSAIDRSSGYGSGGVNSTSIHGVRGLFTASQWMELEHQALIYKYITANVPIPSYLLSPIIKAFESSGFSCFSLLRSSSLGWGANFHLGFSNTDPEPGRCRRTDGKKWRCSRDAVPDQKYCERHINRGRHRSRKPVEVQSGHSATTGGKSTPTAPSTSGGAPKSLSLLHRPEFGSVYSDSLLNPLNNTNYTNSDDINDGTKLSISMITSDFISSTTPSPLRLSIEATQKGQCVGDITGEQNHRPSSWVPASWGRSVGGPLGEALHTTSEGKDSKALNLIENWDNSNSPRFGVFSPRAESTKTTLDGRTFCNGAVGPGLMLPSLPAL